MMNTIKKVLISVFIVTVIVSICANVSATYDQKNFPTPNINEVEDKVDFSIKLFDTIDVISQLLGYILAIINIIIIIRYRKIIKNKIVKIFLIMFLAFLQNCSNMIYSYGGAIGHIPSVYDYMPNYILAIVPFAFQIIMTIILIKNIKKNK